jgi:hypothetical protein
MPKKQFINEYQMVFNRILSNPSTRQQLKQYMIKERNSEALEFWEHCQLLLEQQQQQVSKETLNYKVETIYDNFFSTTSKQQINVSASIVKAVREAINTFKECTEYNEKDAFQVFSFALSSVLMSLEKDVFVRFVRSDCWLKYVKKNFKSNTEIEKIAIHKSQLKQMVYSCSDEERDYLTEQDLHMGLSLRRDGIDWKLIYSAKNVGKYVESILIFKTRLQITDDECVEKYGKLKTYKWVINFNCSAHDQFKVMFSSQKHKEIYMLKETYNQMYDVTADNNGDNTDTEPEDNKLNAILYRHVTKLGLPLCKDREAFFCDTGVYLPSDQTYIECMKTVPKDKFYRQVPNEKEEFDKIVMRSYAWSIVENLSDNKSQYVNIISTNLCGSFTKENRITAWGSDSAVKQLLPKFGKNYESAMNWYIDNNRPDVGDEYKRFSLLEKNKDIAANIKIMNDNINQ